MTDERYGVNPHRAFDDIGLEGAAGSDPNSAAPYASAFASAGIPSVDSRTETSATTAQPESTLKRAGKAIVEAIAWVGENGGFIPPPSA